jgi:hypothetical protein
MAEGADRGMRWIAPNGGRLLARTLAQCRGLVLKQRLVRAGIARRRATGGQAGTAAARRIGGSYLVSKEKRVCQRRHLSCNLGGSSKKHFRNTKPETRKDQP